MAHTCLILSLCTALLLLYTPALANAADVVVDDPVSVVRHLHLSFGDAGDDMRVGFSTNASEWVAASFSSICSYWPDTDNGFVTTVECNFVRTYNPSAWRPHEVLPWDLRFVHLKGLKSGLRYGLQCGIRNVVSHRLHLSAKIAHFDFRKPSSKWSFVAFGDLGVEASDPAEGKYAVGFTRKRVEEEVVNMSASFVLHYGDISYARGTDVVWDQFMDAIEPVAAQVPWMVSPGNHDIQPPDSGHELGVPFFARFWMPTQCAGNPYWYSFDYGGIHFISLSTEHASGNGSAQLAFLERDLKQAAGRQPFIVVVGHRPLLSSHMSFGKDNDALSKAQWETWQPLFEKYNVDMSLWGHVHAYERIVHGDMPVITSGMAGQSYCCGTWNYDPPNSSIYREDAHGYLRVSVNIEESPASIHVEYIRSDDGKVHDSFTVFARHHATGFRKPLLDHMPHRRSRSKLQLSLRAGQGAEDSCFHEGGGVAVSPEVSPGFCPKVDSASELVI